mmetsp:Transcript_12111/g.38843  ORF Transcript_12111/g.38843 Transcript_12111/m.38843 type:complete len:303 (-) Transcript_12111:46-954(-)
MDLQDEQPTGLPQLRRAVPAVQNAQLQEALVSVLPIPVNCHADVVPGVLQVVDRGNLCGGRSLHDLAQELELVLDIPARVDQQDALAAAPQEVHDAGVVLHHAVGHVQEAGRRPPSVIVAGHLVDCPDDGRVQQKVQLWQEGEEAQRNHSDCKGYAVIEYHPASDALPQLVHSPLGEQQQSVHHLEEEDRGQAVDDLRRLLPSPGEEPLQQSPLPAASGVKLDVLTNADAEHLQPEAASQVLHSCKGDSVGRGPAHGHSLGNVAAGRHLHKAQAAATKVQGAEADRVDGQLLAWADVVRDRG